MLEWLTNFINAYSLGDWASVLGLPVAIAGFAITITSLRRIRKAAEASAIAVTKVRTDAARMHAVGAISGVLAALDEIKRLHRQEDWAVLPDKYSLVRRSLIVVRETTIGLSDDQNQVLQNALVHVKGMENKIERALSDNMAPDGASRWNAIVASQMDDLQRLLSQIQALAPSE